MQTSGQPTRLIKINRVIEKVSLSRAQIYKMIAAGEFPCQVKLTERSVAWREDELDSWISDRCTSSRKKSNEFAEKFEAAFRRRQHAA
jgi:prophage regulatory protein